MPDPFVMERTRLSPWDPLPPAQRDAPPSPRRNAALRSASGSPGIEAFSSAPSAPPAPPPSLGMRMPERWDSSFSYRFLRRR